MSPISVKPRSTVVHIFQGDDLDPLERLRQEVESSVISAGVGRPKRLGESESVKTAVERYDDFLLEASARAQTIELRALGRKAYRQLKRNHPIRAAVNAEAGVTESVVEQDASWGFNYESFGDDLVPACVVPGQFDTDAERDEFLEDLSDGDWSKLYSAAVRLNEGAGPDPFARLSSRLTQASSETPQSPDRLG